MLKRLTSICWLLLCVLFFSHQVNAQTASTANLTQLQTASFPYIQTCLDVRDGEGKFVHGLRAENLQLREDQTLIKSQEMHEVRHGAQLVVAVNPGESFAIRNSQGTSRYEFIQAALESWAHGRQGSNIDDLSLIFTNGLPTTHLDNPAMWADALQQDLGDLRESLPSLDTLSQAIDLAADPAPRSGMGRAVLFITAPFEGDLSQPFADLASRANQLGIRIFVWLVSGEEDLADSQALVDLAASTGGNFYLYSGGEELPDLEPDIELLRSLYCLTYTSQVNQGGEHQLVAEIQAPDDRITTPSLSFNIDLQPFNSVFVSPVLLIDRKPPSEEDQPLEDGADLTEYLPAEQPISLIVDFPDQRARPLVRTSLYIDGKLAAENRREPFDQFLWDLRSYTNNGSHTLKVEAEDILGLVGSSMDTVIQVNVHQSASAPLMVFIENAPAILPLLAALAVAVVLLLLVISGKIAPTVMRRKKKAVQSTTEFTVAKSPAADHLEEHHPPRRLWLQRRVKTQVYAFLNAISDEEAPASSTPIPLTAQEVTLGSDPQKATLVFNDPSVDALHARILRTREGLYRIEDNHSTAGTWVNYIPVPPGGIILVHGDTIHVGRFSLRFTEKKPTVVRKPVVTPYTSPFVPPES